MNKQLHQDVNTTWRSGTADEFRELFDASPGTIEIHLRRNGGNVQELSVFKKKLQTQVLNLVELAGVDLNQRRTGTQQTITEQIDTSSLGDRVVNREVIQFMRSRNITFTARSLKPFTEVYSFFDNVDVNKYCVPKLIEIEMISGTFEVGEAVGGVMDDTFDPTSSSADNSGSNQSVDPAIVFRVISANHKYGPYNDPTDTYNENPYDRESGNLPTEYTSTTTVLNVDTSSLD